MAWARPTPRGALALAVAVPWALWAAVRALGLEQGHPLVGALALTPYVAATAWLPLLLALALRRWAVALLAGLAAAALLLAIAPRALDGPQAPLPGGRTLSVMTANLRYGNGDVETVMALAQRHGVELLSLQELTPEEARRLERAGARERFPYQVLDARPGARGSGLMSRYPLRAARRPGTTTMAMPEARLALPGVGPVLVKAVHAVPPLQHSVPTWREELRALPRATPQGPLRMLIGDFNATLDHRELRSLVASGYRDAGEAGGVGLQSTYRVWRSLTSTVTLGIAIDHVLVDERAHVTAASVRTIPHSDHRTLLARISLPARR